MRIKRGGAIAYVPASHEDRDRPGVLKRVLFTREELQDGRVQMVNWSLLPVGSSFRAHYHEDMEEVFVILNGKVEMSVGSERFTLDVGDAVAVSPHEIHAMTNVCTEPVQYLVFGITEDKQGKTILA